MHFENKKRLKQFILSQPLFVFNKYYLVLHRWDSPIKKFVVHRCIIICEEFKKIKQIIIIRCQEIL